MPEIRVPASDLRPGDVILSGIRGAATRTVTAAATTAGRSTLITVTCDPPSRYFTEARTTVTVNRPGVRAAPRPARLTAGRYRHRNHTIIRHRRGWFDHDPTVKDWHDQRCSGWYIASLDDSPRFPTLAAACAWIDGKEDKTPLT